MAEAQTEMLAISDAIAPDRMVREIGKDAKKKTGFELGSLLVRSFLCTPFLAYAVALVALLISQGVPSGIAGLLFPVGYIMLSVLGLEMATGSFSVMPIGVRLGIIKWSAVIWNWSWTFLGNLLGGIFFAGLIWFSLTKGGVLPADGDCPPGREKSLLPALRHFRMGCCYRHGHPLQLAGKPRTDHGQGHQQPLRKNPHYLVADCNLLRARFRARCRQYVCISAGDSGRRQCNGCRLVAVEPDPGNRREHHWCGTFQRGFVGRLAPKTSHHFI